MRHTESLRRGQRVIDATIGGGLRWLTATAFERQGYPDLAAVPLAELVEPGRLDGCGGAWQLARRIRFFDSTDRLPSRAGGIEEAHRHWAIFSATFTDPDPEWRYLIDEAREALHEVERMAG